MAYVFDRLQPVYGAATTPADQAVAGRLAGYWANFARKGDPNGPGLPAWPRYDAKTDRLLAVRPDGTFAGEADLGARASTWRERAAAAR